MELEKEERRNLSKWGKARRLEDEDKVQIVTASKDRYQLQVNGDTDTYTVGIDIDTGQTFCPCPFHGENCSHQIAAHLHLTKKGTEKTQYN
ncbi:MAG: hypothetical protein ABEJ93_04655 [Candidatus Nanohalobium sp.]